MRGERALTRKRRIRYPSKREMNLYTPRRTGNSLSLVIPAALLMAVLVGLFTRFAVLDRLRRLYESERELGEMQARLATAAAELGEYEQVREDYYRRTDAYLSESDAALVDRLDILALLEARLPAYAEMGSVSITDNSAVLRLYAASLDDIAALQRSLEAEELVKEVTVYNAGKNIATEDGTGYVEATVLVRLGQEAEE